MAMRDNMIQGGSGIIYEANGSVLPGFYQDAARGGDTANGGGVWCAF